MGWNLKGSDSRLISEINITPLTDVMLVLLVIFMVTTPLIIMDSFKVKLPKATTASVEAGTGIIIAVSLDGRIEINGKPVATESLESTIKDELSGSTDKTVVVKADGDVRHAVVVEVLDAARLAGAEKLSIATEKDKKN